MIDDFTREEKLSGGAVFEAGDQIIVTLEAGSDPGGSTRIDCHMVVEYDWSKLPTLRTS